MREECDRKAKKEKLKKKIIDHLKEDMSEARIGISRDKDLTKSVKKTK